MINNDYIRNIWLGHYNLAVKGFKSLSITGVLKSIIREVIESSDEDFVRSLVQNNEHYQAYTDFQGYIGINKNRLDDTGMFTSLEEQITNKLIPLEELAMMETDHYLDMQHNFDNDLPYAKEKKVLNLIQKGIAALNTILKHPSEPQEPIPVSEPTTITEPEPEPTIEPEAESMDMPPKEKTIDDIINEKKREISSLKEEYVDADIDDNEELKTTLKQQIKEIKTEITQLNSLTK